MTVSVQVLAGAVLLCLAAAAARRAFAATRAWRAVRRFAALPAEEPVRAPARTPAARRPIDRAASPPPSTRPATSSSLPAGAASPSRLVHGHEAGEAPHPPRHLGGAPLGRRAVAALRRARVPGSATRWWAAWRAAVPVAAVAGALAAGPGGALLLAAVAAIGPAVALHLTRGRADAAYERCVPVVLDETARQLRAGRTLGEALVRAGGGGAGDDEPRLQHDLEQLGRALERGETLAEAIVAWARARPLPGVRLAAAALSLAASQGGGQARAVDGVAATLRQRLDRAAEIRAATAQSRASVAVLGLAPLAFALAAMLLDPSAARAAISSTAGLLSISAGLVLDLVAVAWMNRLTRAV